MTTNWQTKPLGEICDVLDRLRKPITKSDRISGAYPYYGATGILDYVESFIFDEKLVLIGEDGAKWGPGENTAFIVDGEYWVNNHAHVIRPHRNVIVDEWLVYLLNSSDLSCYITGVTVPKLNQEKLRNIPIPLPPLPEQRRIVAILDKAFAAIEKAKENAEKNLQNANELFESHLQTVFTKRGEGWNERPLCEFVQSISTGPFGSLLHKSDYQNGGIPLINPINIDGDKIVPDQRKAVGKTTARRLVRYALEENDIIIGRRGEIGRCAVVTREQVGWLCGTGCFVIRPSDKTNAHFLAHLLRSKPYRRRLEGKSKRATMPNISNDDLADLIVYLPSISAQNNYLSVFQQLSTETQRLKALYSQKLAALDELKQSLLQKAFRGEL